ncbi:MAG: 1-acyl-sn-glycerol-3-phosphate acyltransferase [Anaerolineales bacterium]|nr:1-acyl-sn-glycerol-3-phosphate acyltransferase [Anaerolineales bacterium]
MIPINRPALNICNHFIQNDLVHLGWIIQHNQTKRTVMVTAPHHFPLNGGCGFLQRRRINTHHRFHHLVHPIFKQDHLLSNFVRGQCPCNQQSQFANRQYHGRLAH